MAGSKSLTYKLKFYFFLLTVLFLVIITLRRFIFPALDVVQEFEVGKIKMENTIDNPNMSNELKLKYNRIQDKLGVSDEKADKLQIQLLTRLESCTTINDTKISEAVSLESKTNGDFTFYFHDISLIGEYENLLKSLNCIEQNMEFGIISSATFKKDKKQNEITLHISTQNIVRN